MLRNQTEGFIRYALSVEGGRDLILDASEDHIKERVQEIFKKMDRFLIAQWIEQTEGSTPIPKPEETPDELINKLIDLHAFDGYDASQAESYKKD